MNRNRKLVLVILSVIILIAIFLSILLFNKSSNENTNQQQTQKPIDQNQIAVKPGTKIPNSEILTPEENHKHNEFPSTVFDSKKDNSKIGSYHLTAPMILQGSKFPGFNRNIINAEDGYIYAYNVDEQTITYYNPIDRDTFNVTSNVTQAKYVYGQKKIVFEKKTDKGYTLYLYDYEKDKYGFEELVILKSPAVDFGLNGDFVYYSIKEQPGIYSYQPIPNSSEENQLLGFNQVDADLLAPDSNEGFVSYKKSNVSFNKLKFGQTPIEHVTFPELFKEKTLVELEVNPYELERFLYLTSYSDVETYNVGTNILINGELSPDLKDVLNIMWMDKETVLYTTSSYTEDLYLYNIRTKEKHLIANQVNSFAYDNKSNTIYFMEYASSELKKIQVIK